MQLFSESAIQIRLLEIALVLLTGFILLMGSDYYRAGLGLLYIFLLFPVLSVLHSL